MTRVAKLNPAMWTELMAENADFLTGELNGLIERLSLYRDALSARDEEALLPASRGRGEGKGTAG